jgi:CBS domain-containing protein
MPAARRRPKGREPTQPYPRVKKDQRSEQSSERRDTMKVKEIMSGEPRVCSPDTNLAAAAALMLAADCGILPVLSGGKLAGVVTDRDMFIALATRNKPASQLKIEDVLQQPVHTCGPDDDVKAALETMKQQRVRRLPVEGLGGTVVGVISMNDIVLAAGPKKAISDADVAKTLRSICAHGHPAPTIVAA